ncbi:MAG: histidine phosphatase family protein [Rhizobiales bacterium]|nr:histidine phosphatase family protein [Hyphomicrobiales bacterium]
MRRLLLLRHAKSSWATPGLDDRDRPLTKRGEAAAAAIGKWITEHGLVPETVLCSPAKRARETWKYVAPGIKQSVAVTFLEDIYDFGNGGKLIDAASSQPDTIGTLMIVGHNPSMERAARRLSQMGDAKLIARMEKKYPAAALAVIEFPTGGWSEIAKGTLRHFIRPKDLGVSAAD